SVQIVRKYARLMWQSLCDGFPGMETYMRFRLSVLAGLIALTVGCGSSSPSSPSTGTTGTPVSIVNGSSTLTTTAYSPNPVSIAVGGTVTWTNNDSTAHTATGDNRAFSSGNTAPGGKVRQTVSPAGTFPYKCTIPPHNGRT